MKKNLIINPFILVVLSALSWHAGYAQTAQQYLKKVAAATQSHPLRFSVEYAVFASGLVGKPIQVMSMDYRLKNDLISYDFADVTVFINHKFSLSIDHAEKRMVLNKVNPKFEKKYLREMTSFNVDSIVAKYANLTIADENDSMVLIKVTYVTGNVNGFEHSEIVVDKRTSRLVTLTLQYRRTFEQIYGRTPTNVSATAKPKLVLSFGQYREIEAADIQSLFYASDVLTLDSKGNAKVAAKYKSYSIANYYKLK